MNKNIWTIILIAIIIVIFGGVFWYYKTQFNQMNQSASLSQNQTSQQTKTATSTQNSAKIKYKMIDWVDPKNTVYGFHFDVPSSWIEEPGNERSVSINSCSYGTNGCDENSIIRLQIQVNPPNSDETLVIPDYTKQGEIIIASSTIDVDGVPGQLVVGQLQNANGSGKQPGNNITAYLLFQKDNVQYLGTISGDQELAEQTKPIASEILSSFAFEAPEAQNPPAEYVLLKNLSTWGLTYQNENIKIACSDGNAGTTSQGYVFSMTASPSNQDVNTLYTNVVSTLENNGWTQCNSSSTIPQAPSAVFVKNNRLIEVSRYYSNGVGNSLIVQIQY